MLQDGNCSAYGARPLVCRQTTSLDVAGCIEEFEGTNLGSRIEVSSAHLAHAGNAHVILLGVLHAAGLPDTAYELGAALEIALSDPQCEERWLAGEDVFAALPRDVQRPADVEHATRQLAAALA